MYAFPRQSNRYTLLNLGITTALTAVPFQPIGGLDDVWVVGLQANFTYGSGGTSADVWVQSSLDFGVTWFDIANFHFLLASLRKGSAVVADPATPFPVNTTLTSGALAANTVLNGLIGDRLRALVTTVGVYAGGTSLAVDLVVK